MIVEFAEPRIGANVLKPCVMDLETRLIRQVQLSFSNLSVDLITLRAVFPCHISCLRTRSLLEVLMALTTPMLTNKHHS